MKILNQVENILKASTRARNSDKELLIIYMQKFGMNLSLEQMAKFRNMPSVETIRRSRQIWQEKGMYLASPEVEQARFDKYIQVKHGIKDEPTPEIFIEGDGYASFIKMGKKIKERSL